MMIDKAIEYYLDPSIDDYFSDGSEKSGCFEETD